MPYRLVRRRGGDDDATRLDATQRSAVAHTAGPLLVLGGPGTGKTTTLVEAVAARVAEGVDPERVLVLTFGRRAAGALRRRVERRIARGVVSQPLVRSFHAYAYALLRRAAAQRGEPAPRLLTGPEQDLVIRELLAGAPERWPERLRAALPTRAFAAQLRDLLLRAAERGIDAAQLDALGAKVGRDDWRAAAAFKAEYDAVLALRDATGGGAVGYDHAELVRAAADLLADDPALQRAERQRLQAVYVDEYADTDPAQRDLLALVAGAGAPLVVFADPDSSTYGFRGGDPDGVREFPDRFLAADGGRAPTVLLRDSYRCGATLLAAVARVGRRLRGPARHRALRPVTGLPDGRVEVLTFRTAVGEHARLAHRLREIHLRESVPWSRMAVLVRAGTQLARVQRALRATGVPTVTHGEDLPLHAQPAVAPLLSLLRCALELDRLDEEAAVGLLHSPLGGADPLAERRLRQGLRALALSAGDQRPSGPLLVEALREPAELAMVDRQWAAPARRVAALMAAAQQAAAVPGATIEDVLWAVWQRSGLAERWTATAVRAEEDPARSEAADRDLDAVVVLFDAAARFADRLPGARPLAFLDYVQSQQLPADTLAPAADRGEAVRLLTAHAAKGLEWDVVALPGVQEGVWPDLRLRGSLLGAEQLVDLAAGRELGPVGQTSALLDEERRLFQVAVTRARRHLLVSAVAAASVGEADQAEEPSRFLRELATADHAGQDPADSQQATAAGEDVPAAGTDASAAGTVASAAGTEGPGSGLPALVADRQELVEWMSGRFDAIEHAAVWLAGPERARAEAMVDKLLRWVAANPRRVLAVEREFVVRLDGPQPVELRGRVDRLERDEAGRLVVVDLKTGKSAPPAADIAAHAQLGAYQEAVAAGAFADEGAEPGGAALVQLGTAANDAREQVQPPPSGTDDPGWAGTLVRRTGEVMAGATFTAVRNDRCRTCPVRTSCPISGQGRQVVQP